MSRYHAQRWRNMYTWRARGDRPWWIARRVSASWMYTDAAWYTWEEEEVESRRAHSLMTMEEEEGGWERVEKVSVGAGGEGEEEEEGRGGGGCWCLGLVGREVGRGAEKAGWRRWVGLRGRRGGWEVEEEVEGGVWPLWVEEGGGSSASTWYTVLLLRSSFTSIMVRSVRVMAKRSREQGGCSWAVGVYCFRKR